MQEIIGLNTKRAAKNPSPGTSSALIKILVLGLFLIGLALSVAGSHTRAMPLAGASSWTSRPGGMTVQETAPRIVCATGYTATLFAEGLSAPDGLAFNPDGVLYVAEEAADRVSQISPDGQSVPVLSGLNHPEGIAFDDANHLYVVEDVVDGRLIQMNPDGTSQTVATGLEAPEGVVWRPDGTLFVTESNLQFEPDPANFRTHVTAVSPLGEVTRVRTDAPLWSYAGITRGPGGLLYVTNEAAVNGLGTAVFSIDPDSAARNAVTSGPMAPEGLRFSAGPDFPLYVAEEDTGAGMGRLTRVKADGSYTPLCTGFYSIEDVVLDTQGRIYVSEDGSGSIIRIEPAPPSVPIERARPDGMILFIGDGLGEGYRTAARWSATGLIGSLAMDRMPAKGWTHTAPAEGDVTDSAAAATALATGVKTTNGVVGLDPGGTPLTTILERAQAQGLAVGLVTTTQLTHATPAAFATHVASRTMVEEIARQMLAAGVDVLLGGGESDFLPPASTGCYPASGKRTDGRDLIAEAVASGYTYVCDAAGLAGVDPASTPRMLGLFADEGMTRPFSPSLAAMTQKALDILSQDPDGFFLMVEGGQIDWAGHANDAANAIGDTLGLDAAVALAQGYAAREGDVLIITTADHETGGLHLSLTSSGDPEEDGPFHMPAGTAFYAHWSTTGHTPVDVPTTAQGPWSHLLAGTHDNTDIHDVMRQALESAPELALAQQATPPGGERVSTGARIQYTLLLTNSGIIAAQDLVLTDTLPAGTVYAPDSLRVASGLHVQTLPPPGLVLTGTLPAGAALSTTLQVTVSDVLSGTPLVNTTQVRARRAAGLTSQIVHTAFTPNGAKLQFLFLPILYRDD